MRRPKPMIPDWIITLIWFCAGVCATGAFWYFLSIRNNLAALWTGFGAIGFTLTGITCHIHNDMLRNQKAVEATAAPSPSPLAKATLASPALLPAPSAESNRSPVLPSNDEQEAKIASSDNNFSSISFEEFVEGWYRKATTSLQRDELQEELINKRVIWSGIINTISKESNGDIAMTVEPVNKSYGTAFLKFDKSQRPQLVKLQKGQTIRFTGRIESFVASPFFADCQVLRIIE